MNRFIFATIIVFNATGYTYCMKRSLNEIIIKQTKNISALQKKSRTVKDLSHLSCIEAALTNTFIVSLKTDNDPLKEIDKKIKNMTLLNHACRRIMTTPATIFTLAQQLKRGNPYADSIALDSMNIAAIKGYLSASIYLHKNINNLSQKDIAWFIHNGADLNYYSHREKYPHILLSVKTYEKMKFLLEKGADMNIEVRGTYPLLKAIENKNIDAIRLLLTYQPQQTYLTVATQMKFIDAIKAILKITRPDQTELNASLKIASEQQNNIVIDLLLNAGADISIII
jgi:ankyrin repeat protein